MERNESGFSYLLPQYIRVLKISLPWILLLWLIRAALASKVLTSAVHRLGLEWCRGIVIPSKWSLSLSIYIYIYIPEENTKRKIITILLKWSFPEDPGSNRRITGSQELITLYIFLGIIHIILSYLYGEGGGGWPIKIIPLPLQNKYTFFLFDTCLSHSKTWGFD